MPQSAATLHAPSHNLPSELTSFVDRRRELDDLKRLLKPGQDSPPPQARHGLVTLTGPGGSGKTRLALRVASSLVDRFTEGVWWVELAAVSATSLVPHVIAAALGLPEPADQAILHTLTVYLQPKRLLLILDNCEHLRAACADLAQVLLAHCPRLVILATSRELLGIEGETVWPVEALPVPSLHPLPSLQTLATVPSVRLFIERARAARRDFELTARNSQAIGRICRRLDGIPLAIELAAARVNLLSPEQIATRLDNALHLLTIASPAVERRHQAMRATLDWSYSLLTETEQKLLRRLTVFAGSFNLETVEAICAGDGVARIALLDLLTALVSKSLVTVINLDEEKGRYRLLEVVRQFGSEALAATGDAEAIQERHADYWAAEIQRMAAEFERASQLAWVRALDLELDNVRAALAWAIEHGEPARALGMTAGVWEFWQNRGYYAEGCDWLDQALARAPEATPARVTALYGSGQLALRWGKLAAASRYYSESLALAREIGDERGAVRAFHRLGGLAWWQGDIETTRARLQEVLPVYRRLGNRRDLAEALNGVGLLEWSVGHYAAAVVALEEALAIRQSINDELSLGDAFANLGRAVRGLGDYSRARVLSEEGLTRRRAIGNRRGVGQSLLELGVLAQLQGQYAEAWQNYANSVTAFHDIGDVSILAMALDGLASLAAAQGQFERAIRLLGATTALRAALGIAALPTHRAESDGVQAAARAHLDAAVYAVAWARGQTMSVDQAVTYALEPEPSPAAAAPLSPPRPASLPEREKETPLQAQKRQHDGLTRRERDIAALIAQGLSNQAIADDLVIGLGTVEAHVSRILGKLHFTKRTQVAVWAVENGLGRSASSRPSEDPTR
ncbi:MAG: tetratricopeptide repeat protein [Anaerolineae bacterium]|nr:tetratricopeptide repeat protein [Anaerolineae bacterium]